MSDKAAPVCAPGVWLYNWQVRGNEELQMVNVDKFICKMYMYHLYELFLNITM